MIDDYAKHAAVWDWDGYDNSLEYEYWCTYAAQFGNTVLVPMCAIGQCGAYMAQKGFHVTAFDITREMIDEGKMRFGTIENLSLIVADICDFQLNERNYDFVFIASQDLHLLPEIVMVKRAFMSIAAHLRKDACLALELVLPSPESYEYPTQTYYPRVPHNTDKKVWKDGKGRYDAKTKTHYIDQVVYIQHEEKLESFDYSIILRYYDREEIIDALVNAGFTIASEYCNRKKVPWTPQSNDWIVEAIRK